MMVGPGTVSVRLGRVCDTAFRTVCFFTGIELGIPCCTYLLTYKYCVCLSVSRFCTFWKTLLYEREKLKALAFVSRIRFKP